MPTNPDTTAPAYKIDQGIRSDKSRGARDKTSHIGGMYFSIPEYHDEQRFQISATAFGPTVYLYSSPFLGAFSRMEDIVEQGSFGAFAALIDVDVPAGTVLAKEYTALNLQPGSNCLWLANVNGTNGGWRAFVTPIGPMNQCQRPPAGSTPPALGVMRYSNAEYRHADYPAVARFGEARIPIGGTYGQPLIGVKCLDGWCEIGPSGEAPKSNARGAALGKYGEIKGWSDEQILISKDAAGVLSPSVRATLVPDRRLAEYGARSFPLTDRSPANRNVGWLPVATIVLEADPGTTTKYWNWGLRQGENYLFLRRVGPTDKDWQMSIVRPGSSTRFIWENVVRETHTDVLVPPTARWRFASFDPDGVWVRCGEACCSGDGGGG